MKRSLTVLAASAGFLLTGCGGGSDDLAGTRFVGTASGGSSSAGIPAAAPLAVPGPALEGFWGGTAGPYEFGVLGLADGDLFVAYTRNGQLQGVMAGTATTTTSGLLAAKLVDFNGPLRAITSGTAAGQYTPQGPISATVQLGASTSYAFTAAYDATYDTPADLAKFAGTWTGTGASRDGVTTGTFTLGADGSISGSTPFCTYSGQAAPYPPGKAPLRLVLTFTGATCPLAGKSATGVAVVRQFVGAQQLLAFGQTDDGSDFFVTLGQR